MAERHKVEKTNNSFNWPVKVLSHSQVSVLCFVTDTLSLTKKIKNACVKWPRVCFGATAEYPATLYHHCFRWSAFFEERSITQ